MLVCNSGVFLWTFEDVPFPEEWMFLTIQRWELRVWGILVTFHNKNNLDRGRIIEKEVKMVHILP